MKEACDEMRECSGYDKEEPYERRLQDSCKVRVVEGAEVIDRLLDSLRVVIYEYNTTINDSGYYLKPVHKVYKRRQDGSVRVYEYYGRYWWRMVRKKGGYRAKYAGKVKPRGIRNAPELPIEGLVIVREGRDIIMDCDVYERYKHLFHDRQVIGEY